MPKIKITMRAIEAERTKVKDNAARKVQRGETAPTATLLWDTELKGFGARVEVDGHVSWLVQVWSGGRGGKAARIAIGHFPPMGIDEARKQAAIEIGDHSKGIDIRQRKKDVLRKTKAVVLSGKLHDVFERYLNKQYGSGQRHRSEVERFFNCDVFPVLGKDTPIIQITKQQVRDLINSKEETAPGAARNLFAAMRPFFKWCVSRDLIEKSPLADLPSPKVPTARDRILSDDEVKAFWNATGLMGWPFGPYYRLLLLTGQRREEVTALSWDELDLQAGVWTIPKARAKNGKEHRVHLSPQAMAIIAELPRTAGSPFVFTTTGDTPISGHSKSKSHLDGLIAADLEREIPPFRTHDLRRTAASGMARLGFQPHIIERVLNHISGATGGLVGVYQRYDYLEERKRALEEWGRYLETLVSGVCQSNNVVQRRQSVMGAPQEAGINTPS